MSTGKSKEKTRRRLIMAAFGSAVLLAMATGCGREPSENPEADGQEVTKLRVIYSSGDIRWTGSVEWVAERFMEAHPDIQVTLFAPTDVAGQSFADRLRVLIAQDEFYDVTELREDVLFSEAGYLAPLPECVTKLVAGLKPGEVCYAVPRYTTTLGMIYNQEVFRKLGLSEPESYEEFLDVCETLRRADICPIAAGGADLWHMGFWGNYLYQNYILDEQGENCWSSERIAGMLEDFRDLSRRGYLDARFAEVSDSQTVHELSSGSGAMVYSGPWIIDQIMGLNPGTEPGFFYLPGKDGKIRAAVDRSATWGISRECHKDEARWQAAVDFLEFFYSEGIYEHVLIQMNAEPVTVREMKGEGTRTQEMVREAGQGQVVFCPKFVGDEDTPDGFRSFYDQSLQEVLWGDRPIEDIAQELADRWSEGSEGGNLPTGTHEP